jgi:hypothetical protein
MTAINGLAVLGAASENEIKWGCFLHPHFIKTN